jgi:hypothetical protein
MFITYMKQMVLATNLQQSLSVQTVARYGNYFEVSVKLNHVYLQRNLFLTTTITRWIFKGIYVSVVIKVYKNKDSKSVL